jgi:hypothetical protein
MEPNSKRMSNRTPQMMIHRIKEYFLIGMACKPSFMGNSCGAGPDSARCEHLHYIEMNSRKHPSIPICVSPWPSWIRNLQGHDHWDQHCRSPKQRLFTIAHNNVPYCSQQFQKRL